MSSATSSTIRKPIAEHVRELQVRLTWIVLSVGLCSGIAYWLHPYLLKLLQKPLGQTLYYSSPTGGFTFLFKLSITAGCIIAIPVILFNIFRYIEPVLEKRHTKGIYKYIVASFLLAYGGAAFGYLVSLPSALRFLASFSSGGIEALISANDYFNFALAYVGGFAALFQLPLIILFVNRITPLKPGKLMRAQRFVVLGSFVIAAVLTPTPDPFNQFMMAAPMVVLYQIAIILVVLTNRRVHRQKLAQAKKALARQAKAQTPLQSSIAPHVNTQPLPVSLPNAQLNPANNNLTPATLYTDPMLRRQSTPVTLPRQYLLERTKFVMPLTSRTMVGNDFL